MAIDGPQPRTLLPVCRDEECRVHAAVTRCEPTLEGQAARTKEGLGERIEKQTSVRTLDVIRKKLPVPLPRLDLEMAVLDHFERLGHGTHCCLGRVYGWEEKKTKVS
jgi:hypothetical protein